jgi:hypothetical protein
MPSSEVEVIIIRRQARHSHEDLRPGPVPPREFILRNQSEAESTVAVTIRFSHVITTQKNGAAHANITLLADAGSTLTGFAHSVSIYFDRLGRCLVPPESRLVHQTTLDQLNAATGIDQ